MSTIFILLALLCIYSYFLYPILLQMTPTRVRSPSADAQSHPPASLIITVHNEESRIVEKLENSLALEYPGRLEIIIASDMSTDATDEIVAGYAGRGVKLVRADQRLGKEYAQLCAIREAEGEILIFSDVATQIPEHALPVMVGYFDDPGIGAVSSEDQFVSRDGSIVGEGAYVRYEMWLRAQETMRAGLVGLSGSFFAARKSVCDRWDIHCPSDFNTALNCARAGMVAISSPDVKGVYTDVSDPAREYQRKLRTVIRGMTAMVRHPEVLNPFRFGYFTFQVFSHKLMRWAVPWFMFVFAVMTLLMVGEGLIYDLALYAQIAFYAAAIAGWLSAAARSNALIRIIYYFVSTNLALAHAAAQFVSGKRMSIWTPTQR